MVTPARGFGGYLLRRNSRNAAIAHLVFEHFARSPENSCGPRLADSYFNACDLSVVEPLEEQQMTAIIHNHDHDSGATFLCFGLCSGSDLLRCIERQDFL